MIFETLDSKEGCVGIYADDSLVFDRALFPKDLTGTWAPTHFSAPLGVEYASLYIQGEKVEDIIPEYLLDDWQDAMGKLRSFDRSFNIAQIDKAQHCFYDIVPTRFLRDYCDVRTRITEYVLENIDRPARYPFYHHVALLLYKISQQPIELDERILRSLGHTTSHRNYVQKMLGSAAGVHYNQFGTRTGRLTTTAKSFPILTLPRTLRGAVRCKNDYFVELDFNGAEIRTLLGLLEKPQPHGDIHQFHLDHVFPSGLAREEVKTAFFAWLYGSKTGVSPSTEKALQDFYDKEHLLAHHWAEGTVTTHYGKIINDVSAHHALNYIVQSTAAELLLKQALKINHLFEKRAAHSFIAFLIHDSVVLDFAKEDEHLLDGILRLFSSTNFGTFGINIKRGTTLGNLK